MFNYTWEESSIRKCIRTTAKPTVAPEIEHIVVIVINHLQGLQKQPVTAGNVKSY